MNDPGVRRRVFNWGRIALIAGAVAALVAVTVGVRALSAPVERAGVPTIAVPSPSGTRFTSPSPSPSASGTESGTASPSATASASGTPSSSIKASGDFDWATTTAAAAGSQGKLYRYAVAVESSAKLKANTVAGTVAGVLNDPRSWTGDGEVRFALVPQSKATVKLYLASTKTAATLCGSDGEADFTCVKGDVVVINAGQWKTAAASYAGDLDGYRTFLVNHAIGHLLGQREAQCAGSGKKAPVMLQQGAGLDGCTANPWP
ncbi:DUF3152 domain-containing protein [Micropruina sp.]|uniref:DUF3152 domain-containing protein n=1 Tax=Micropruina sp. TaxID=2737536 RepID=UPI0039E716F6